MLLFLVACGLTVTFGLLRVVNLAHGAFYVAGGYIAYALVQVGVPWYGALALAVAAVATAAALVERLLIRRVAQRELPQILLTVGIAYIVGDAIVALAGGAPLSPARPPGLDGVIVLGDASYPRFRIALIAYGVAVFAGLEAVFTRTRIGIQIRAAIDDREMARSIGIAVPRLFTLVFTVGAALAAAAGVIGSAFTGLEPQSGFSMLILALAVVVVGGLGSVRGAFIAAIAIGAVVQFGTVYFPAYALFATYLPVAIILAIRPRGLLGDA